MAGGPEPGGGHNQSSNRPGLEIRYCRTTGRMGQHDHPDLMGCRELRTSGNLVRARAEI